MPRAPDLVTDRSAARVAARGPAGAAPIVATDGELLASFVGRRDGEIDDAAFARLLDRHAAMVWRVCRQVLPNPHDAEDAFQATFLILARQARSIRVSESVAGWLYRVAHRTALAAKRRAKKRRESALETEPASPAEEPFPDLVGRHAAAALMEELDRLPAKYRGPLVMRYLEGASRRAIADQTDTTIAAVQGRLARGKQLLRRRLIRRGVSLSVAMAVVGLGAGRAEAAPARLLAQTTTGATNLVAGGSLTASAAVLALYDEGVRVMLFSSIGKPAAAAAGVGVLLAALVAPSALLASDDAAASLALSADVASEPSEGDPAPMRIAQRAGGDAAIAVEGATASADEPLSLERLQALRERLRNVLLPAFSDSDSLVSFDQVAGLSEADLRERYPAAVADAVVQFQEINRELNDRIRASELRAVSRTLEEFRAALRGEAPAERGRDPRPAPPTPAGAPVVQAPEEQLERLQQRLATLERRLDGPTQLFSDVRREQIDPEQGARLFARVATVDVRVDGESRVWVGDRAAPTGLEELPGVLREVVVPGGRAMIRAQRDAPAGAVQRVAAACREAGLRVVIANSLAVPAPPTPPRRPTAPPPFGLPHGSVYLGALRATPTYRAAPGDTPVRFELRLRKKLEQWMSRAQQEGSPIHFVTGRVLLDEGDDPKHVAAQMQVWPEGYFLDVVRDSGGVFGLRKHGYHVGDIDLSEHPDTLVIDVGEVRLEKTAKDELRSLTASIRSERGATPVTPRVTLRTALGPINNYTNGYEGTTGEPRIKARVTKDGRLAAEGLSPIEYHVYFEADGFARKHVKIDLREGEGDHDLGEVTLAPVGWAGWVESAPTPAAAAPSRPADP